MEEITVSKHLYPQPYFRIPAKLISILLHPLFIPTYVFLWLTLRFPTEFQGITPFLMLMRKINVFWMTAFFPAFAVFLLWRLRFIDNIMLRTQRERITPYIITMVFYWWMWYLSRNFTDQPAALQFFYFGIFLTTIFGLLSNIFTKISMHAMGMAGAFMFVVLSCLYYQQFLGADLTAVTLLTGIVCTARLLLDEHQGSEMTLGFIVGAFCQIAAYKLIM
jgi:hypothetical protein